MIKIERHLDATFLNSVVNHPAVRPDVQEVPEGYLDLSNVVADQRHVALMGEHGGVVFVKTQPGTYEAHTQAMPEGRGPWIAQFVRLALDWMFTNTDAFEVTTRIPEEHRSAIRLAEHAGMTFEFAGRNPCLFRGKKQKALIYSLRIQEWARAAENFDQAGRDFHEFLHREAERIGHKGVLHEDDQIHNRYLAISIAMLKAGQTYKALAFFNRWAILVRDPLIWMVKDNPPTFRIDLGHLILENDTMRVEPVDVAA